MLNGLAAQPHPMARRLGNFFTIEKPEQIRQSRATDQALGVQGGVTSRKGSLRTLGSGKPLILKYSRGRSIGALIAVWWASATI